MTASYADKFLEFTSSEAAQLFECHTGFLLHCTVPGQLLARLGIEKKDRSSRPSTYDAKHWTVLWTEMMSLAMERCRHDSALKPPFQTFVNSIHAARGMPPNRPRIESETSAQGDSPNKPDSVQVWKKTKSKTNSEPLPHPKRCFIKVPFAEKDEAKALGARFDFSFKMWYIPKGKNRKLFRWPDEVMPSFMRLIEPMEDPLEIPKSKDDARSRTASAKAKKISHTNKGRRSTARLEKEMESRLNFLLEE